MIQRRFGAICFTNSLTTFVPIYGFSTYSATKAALKAFAEVINQEVAGMGILVANAFLPSVNTPGYQREKQVRHRVSDIKARPCFTCGAIQKWRMQLCLTCRLGIHRRLHMPSNV